jgi:hypothetical protein
MSKKTAPPSESNNRAEIHALIARRLQGKSRAQMRAELRAWIATVPTSAPPTALARQHCAIRQFVDSVARRSRVG